MDLMEYQAKELFAKHGVPVLPGETVDTIIAELEAGSSPYADPRLPAEMRRARDAMRRAGEDR